jgi:hypothetical protein
MRFFLHKLALLGGLVGVWAAAGYMAAVFVERHASAVASGRLWLSAAAAGSVSLGLLVYELWRIGRVQ